MPEDGKAQDAENKEIPTRHESWLNRNVFGISLTSLFSDMSHEMATAILPFFILLVGGSAAVVGLVEGASDAASSAVKSYSGYWSDVSGRRTPVMYLGYALTGILIPSIGLATSWIHVLVLRVCSWMGRGARGPPRDALLSESVTPETTGKAFGFQRSMDTVGAIIGPGIAFLLIPLVPLSTIFFVSFIPGAAALATVVALVRDRARPRSTREVIGFRASVKNLPRRFNFFLIGVGLFGIANFSNVIFTLRAEQILVPSLGARGAEELAIALYVVLNVVYAASAYPAGYLADKMSKRGLLAIGYLLFAAACVVSMFEVPSLIVLLPIFILAGIHTGFVDTLEGSFASELLTDPIRGTGYGVLHTVNGVGDFVSSTMIGVLWVLLSPALGFAVVALIAVVASILLVTLTGGK